MAGQSLHDMAMRGAEIIKRQGEPIDVSESKRLGDELTKLYKDMHGAKLSLDDLVLTRTPDTDGNYAVTLKVSDGNVPLSEDFAPRLANYYLSKLPTPKAKTKAEADSKPKAEPTEAPVTMQAPLRDRTEPKRKTEEWTKGPRHG